MQEQVRRPVVLLPSGWYEEEGTLVCRMGKPYIECVEQSGATAVVVPPSCRAVEQLMDMADGLLLCGGEDVHPRCYRANPQVGLGRVDPARDWLELEMTRLALERQMPVLGICRGIQLLNVAAGGTLYQDIQREIPGAGLHQQQAPDDTGFHEVQIDAGSYLAGVCQEESLWVNSFHHQAVKELGEGLRAVATSVDGVIEALEGCQLSSPREGESGLWARDDAPAGAFVLGIQWHLERMWKPGSHDANDRIVRAFIGAAAAYRRRRQIGRGRGI